MMYISPIEMITSPNFFKEMVEWKVTTGSPVSLWFQIKSKDSLGDRRWFPSAGASMKVEFMRARSVAIGQASQTFQKTAAQDSRDPSLWRVDLTLQDVALLVSGTVKFVLTEGAVSQIMVQNYFIVKTLTEAGC